ncbi:MULTISPECIES: hypothetical protein [Thermomonosporaceae]|uniref:hypothetical protein n=1 Tax=Thermomonosporaceae TaxID=2012 RepID=UPI00255B2332|nr:MULTISPECIES: hypothetical protein [Thermomonosporaceae]MDL4773865.1 hypothetical protein [Actinomadura xylanilytica]
MSGKDTEVWIATGDGRDLIRADMIVVVRLDPGGRLTAQLRDESKVTVTLIDGQSPEPLPGDFHRRLIRAVGELADSSGAQVVRAEHDGRVWRWIAEPL